MFHFHITRIIIALSFSMAIKGNIALIHLITSISHFLKQVFNHIILIQFLKHHSINFNLYWRSSTIAMKISMFKFLTFPYYLSCFTFILTVMFLSNKSYLLRLTKTYNKMKLHIMNFFLVTLLNIFKNLIYTLALS